MSAREDGAYFEWWNAYGEMADIDVEYHAYRAGKAYQQKQNSAELAALTMKPQKTITKNLLI